jgi:hypothetical protein
MTCAKVKKSLALLAGGDLPSRKERKLLAHIDGCQPCRREFEEYRSSLRRVKAAAREEGVYDWSGAEWKSLMARATAEKTEKGRPALGLHPRRALTSGLAAVMVLAALAFLFKDSIFKSKPVAPGSGTMVEKKAEPKPKPERPGGAEALGKKEKRVRVIQPEYLAKGAGKEAAARGAQDKAAAGQDVLSVTMVSQETGLQVVWFFNKNFEWKGDQK